MEKVCDALFPLAEMVVVPPVALVLVTVTVTELPAATEKPEYAISAAGRYSYQAYGAYVSKRKRWGL